jgi:hypothetical protein
VYFLAIAVLRRSRGGFMELTQVRKTKWKWSDVQWSSRTKLKKPRARSWLYISRWTFESDEVV